MSDLLLSAPLAEPIHLDEARSHLRAPTGQTGQDADIKRAIRAARSRVEALCRIALVRQQRVLKLDCFPAEIEIPVAPLRAVQSITYLDSAGALQTLASSGYRVLGVGVSGVGDQAPAPGRIEPVYGTVWPSTIDMAAAVTVKYTAGCVVPATAAVAATDFITAAGHDLAASDPVRLSNSGGAVFAGLAVDTNYYAKSPTSDTLQVSLTDGGAAVDVTAATCTGTSFIGSIPPDLVSVMLLIVEHLYQNRSENADFEVFEMPLGAERLMQPFRPYRF
jgi:hypothetical protein